VTVLAADMYLMLAEQPGEVIIELPCT